MPTCQSWAIIGGPLGLLEPSAWSVAHAMNGAWTAQVTFPYPADPTFSPTALWSFSATDGRGAMLVTPPMVAVGPRVLSFADDGPQLTVALIDRTSHRLAKSGQNFDTFRNTTADFIARTIAATAGVPVVGAPTWRVKEEDVKQAKLWDPLLRLADANASNLLIDTSGNCHFVDYLWTADEVVFEANSAEWTYDPSRMVSKITFLKRTSMAQNDRDLTWDSPGIKIQQLPQPMRNIVPSDKSTVGSVTLIGFWTDDPSTGKGELISPFWAMGAADGVFITTPTVPSASIAKYITCTVNAASPPFDTLGVSARLRLLGSVPEVDTGIDVAFEWTYTVPGIPVDQPAETVKSEPLYPTLLHVQQHALAIAHQLNKDANFVQAAGPQDFTVQVGSKLMPMTIYDEDGNAVKTTPPARIESVVHSWAGGESDPSTSLSAPVLPQ